MTTLTRIATKIMKQAGPVRGELLGQMLEALQTGGVQAKIPLIQRSVEASKLAGSQALKGTEEGLARSGLAGTPFGQRQMASTRQQSAFQTSQVPTGIIGALIGAAPSFMANQQGQAMNALAIGGSMQQSADMANQKGWIAFMQDLKQSLQMAGSRGMGGGAGGETTAGSISQSSISPTSSAVLTDSGGGQTYWAGAQRNVDFSGPTQNGRSISPY